MNNVKFKQRKGKSAQQIHMENQWTARELAAEIRDLDEDDPLFDVIWLQYQRVVMAMDYAAKGVF